MQISEAEPNAQARLANLEAAIVANVAQLAHFAAALQLHSEALAVCNEKLDRLARDFYRSPAAEEIG